MTELSEAFAQIAVVMNAATEAVEEMFVSLVPPEEYAVLACGIAESDVKHTLVTASGDWLVFLKNHRIINITRDHSYPRARSTT